MPEPAKDVQRRLQGSRYFATMDLIKSFWQFELAEDSKHLFSFYAYPYGQYKFERVAMGAKNSSAYVQKTMTGILKGAGARERYDLGDHEPSQWPRAAPIRLPVVTLADTATPQVVTTTPQVVTATPQVATIAPQVDIQTKKKKKKIEFISLPRGRIVFFLIDVASSGRDALTTTTTRSRDPAKRGRGRSRKRKVSGRPRKSSVARVPTFRSVVGRPGRTTPLEKGRIESLAFCRPAPFVPKKRGRRGIAVAAGANVVVVRGVKHTLTHMSAVVDPNTGERMWKSDQGRCVCCYAETPSLTAAQRAAKSNARKTVRQSSFACDKCLVCLCRACFHHEWSKHSTKRGVVPIGTVYV